MAAEKALVMEIDNQHMVLLTKDGRFISRRLSGTCPQVGDEITIEARSSKLHWLSLGAFAAAAVLCLVLFAGKLWNEAEVLPTGGTVVTYVSIDINPSIELGLDLKRIVVSVEFLNDDAKTMLKDKDLMGKPLVDAVEIIINAAADHRYLAPEKKNQVIINVSEKDPHDAKTNQIGQILNEKAEKVLKERNLKVKVDLIKTDFNLHKQATKLGISAGKYAILLEAKEAGLAIKADNIKKSGVIKAIKNAGGNPQEIIETARNEKDFAEKLNKWKNLLKNNKKEFFQNQNKERKSEEWRPENKHHKQENDKKGNKDLNLEREIKEDHLSKQGKKFNFQDKDKINELNDKTPVKEKIKKRLKEKINIIKNDKKKKPVIKRGSKEKESREKIKGKVNHNKTHKHKRKNYSLFAFHDVNGPKSVC